MVLMQCASKSCCCVLLSSVCQFKPSICTNVNLHHKCCQPLTDLQHLFVLSSTPSQLTELLLQCVLGCTQTINLAFQLLVFLFLPATPAKLHGMPNYEVHKSGTKEGYSNAHQFQCSNSVHPAPIRMQDLQHTASAVGGPHGMDDYISHAAYHERQIR